jgi:tRNA-dihydrouridine synthase
MRLGWDDGALNAPELARRAEAAGASAVTVHGRTRCQFYRGRADWHAIKATKGAVAIPVIANGDCRTLADALAMLMQSGADGVMVGRAAQGRPWLPGWLARGLANGREPPIPGADIQRDLALEHYEGLLGLYGTASGVRHARKHLSAGMEAAEEIAGPGDARLRVRILTSEQPKEVAADLRRFYDSLAARKAA